MPALYRYKGFTFLKYSNDHNNPPHVHVKKAGNEIKVELIEVGGATWTDKTEIRGKFNNGELQDIDAFIIKYRTKLLLKLEQLHSKQEKPKCEKINKI